MDGNLVSCCNSGMNIVRTVISSVFNPDFYARIKDQEVTDASKSFAILGIAGIGLVMAIGYVTVVIPFAVSKWPEKIEAVYPADLVVTIHNGALSINQPEPYAIKNPHDGAQTKNLVIFDTGDQLTGDLSKNSTYAIVKKSYVISGTPGQERVSSFANQEGTTTITREQVDSVVRKVQPYFAPAVLIGGLFALVFAALIAAAGWVLFHFIYVLIPAALIYLYASAQSLPFSYRQSYMIALYASIPVAILTYALSFVHVSAPPLSYTILLLVVALINITAMQRAAQK